ncbi:MAG: hypothetical protein KAR84_07685 [Elusimicrobiales bacterium]|nr:hypothetical protein [Elusimicrobiales bacterium]MCK5106578.1 hypothetical protein [Elusimicrobiales bacterium]MCK5582442.1 hypothetical protein [Elusimicrobiales bacterium]
MKKILFIIIFAGISCITAYFLYPHILKKLFSVSGTVSLAEKHKNKSNTMLFIVLKNKGDIPIAVAKVINPSFPLEFNLNANNLIMPDLLSRKLYLEAYLNNHGVLGKSKTSDMIGKLKKPILINSKNIKISLFLNRS